MTSLKVRVLQMFPPLLYPFRYLAMTFFPKEYTRNKFKRRLGYGLNLENPKTFNEKIQWLKVHYRDPLIPVCADKADVRAYIREKIGEEYLVPIYGVYEAVEDIDISVLPKEFVLKSTHGSGHVIICTDKDKLNWKQEFDKMRLWLLTNFYYVGGEWQYKEMKPRIICEKLLSANITDYKFFCYNGEPQYLATCIDRLGELRISHYDMDYRPLPFKKKRPDIEKHVKPESFEEMKKIARVLCRDFPFVRVDLYDIDGKIYFSELTFTPGNGLTKFDPIEWDLILGNQFELSYCKKEYVIE